jgi:NAD(P)-dependent dehydrogenase (short-subunit alcohol dehydrogenase family)
MYLDLKDKIAVVTGGGTGIGRAISLAFAESGANVVVASRNQENLDKVAADIKALGKESLAISTNTRDEAQVDSMMGKAKETFGRIDIMVNNAGVGSILSPKPEKLDPATWRDVVDLNLTGTFIGSAAAARIMIEQQSGTIINISSVVSRHPNPMVIAYSAAKAAVNSLTVSLANTWAKHGIRVNAIIPGSIVTEKYHLDVPREAEDGTPLSPLTIPGSVDDVANMALFLASDASKHVSGECMGVMGVMKD